MSIYVIRGGGEGLSSLSVIRGGGRGLAACLFWYCFVLQSTSHSRGVMYHAFSPPFRTASVAWRPRNGLSARYVV